MLIQRKEHNDEDGSIGWIESIFSSSNVLTTTYFPKRSKLYIAFKRGGVYSYTNINEEFYAEFENAESQGEFFVSKIRNKNKYPYAKEYKLLGGEVDAAKKIIKENEELQDD